MPPVELTGCFVQRERNAVFTELPAQGVDGAPYRHRAKEQAVIVLWDGRGVATEGKPYKNSYAYPMRMRDGEVDLSSCDDLSDRVKPGDR